MEFENVIRTRHATRKFKNERIEKEKLEKVLEAGRLAPTAKNNQPIKIYVVENNLEGIDKASPCRYNAPCVLLVCGDKEQAFQKENHSTYEMDACIVATHMMLEATNIGLGNIWVEMFQEDVLREEFHIPNNLIPICLIPIGYEEENCPINPNHLKRKELDDLVEYC
jgi:nitroreductase